MRKGFYARLAAQNLRKNARLYLPYLLAAIGCVAMLYTVMFLNDNSGLAEVPKAQYVGSMLSLGAIVVTIFSLVVIIYTNSFLMKRRRKELGLYNVLGMEKRHIARTLFWETVYTALMALIGGLALGILLSKLMLILLCAILGASVPFGFQVSMSSISFVLIAYAVIFALCLLQNLWSMGKARPVELLRGGSIGDREPKTRWFLTLAGVVTLGGGYWIAMATKDPATALMLFFVAVLLVICGTFCLFTAGSIAVLKLLRKNRRYYYTTRHFTAVSGMLHRMKRNAAGLAAICILSTMVLVTVSTTVCMYTGMGELIDRMYPDDLMVFMIESDSESMDYVEAETRTLLEENGYEIEGVRKQLYYSAGGGMASGRVIGDVLKEAQEGEVYGYTGQEELPTAYIGFDLKGEVPAEEFLDMNMWDRLDSEKLTFWSAYYSTRDDGVNETMSTYGGLFFIGLYLGFLFLMATALIIYYKQLSEGYEDAESFRIMQQVGMSQKEVRESIHGQIRTVFLLPIVAAGVHMAFAFSMIRYMLQAFNMTNTALFALCLGGTLLVFAVIYVCVYLITARSYYRVVKL